MNSLIRLILSMVRHFFDYDWVFYCQQMPLTHRATVRDFRFLNLRLHRNHGSWCGQDYESPYLADRRRLTRRIGSPLLVDFGLLQCGTSTSDLQRIPVVHVILGDGRFRSRGDMRRALPHGRRLPVTDIVPSQFSRRLFMTSYRGSAVVEVQYPSDRLFPACEVRTALFGQYHPAESSDQSLVVLTGSSRY